MTESYSSTCPHCEGALQIANPVCLNCGMPHGRQPPSKRESWRLGFAVALSVGVIVLFQWWQRGS
jgi:hypothetical protein